MPTQTVPLQGLDQVGLVIDSPSITLPENAFSDANNVRFDDGAIRKVRGFVEIFASHGLTDIQYIAYWPNPNQPIWVVVNREERSGNPRDIIYTLTISSDGMTVPVDRSPTNGYTISQGWQHTIFNGGYSFIINNGLNRPQHLTVQQGTDLMPTNDFQDLPGWDSYNSGTVQSNNLRVSAAKVVAFGSVLMAGGLLEVDTSDGDAVVRNLRGVVRSSSVAPLGQIPQNWDPFATGAGTADELLIADTGEITAMVPLQGNMMVYTSDSITRVSVSNQGLSETNITREYGATSIGSVFEYDGRHVVQGSNDIYIFEGHPASIQSISDGRVRRFYYEDVHGSFTDRTRIIRNQTFDEIWVCYVSNANNFGRLDTALTWNYRNNIWSRRSLPNLSAIAVGPVEGGGIDTEEFIFAIPSPRTVTGTAIDSIVEVQRATLTAGSAPAGTQEVQSSVQTGTRSNSTRGLDEIFTLSLPSNFQSAVSATTTSAPTAAPTVPNSAFTGSARGTQTQTVSASNFASVTGLTVTASRTRTITANDPISETIRGGWGQSGTSFTVDTGTAGGSSVSVAFFQQSGESGTYSIRTGSSSGPEIGQTREGQTTNLTINDGTQIFVTQGSGEPQAGSWSYTRLTAVPDTVSYSDNTYTAIYSGDVNIIPSVGGVTVGTSSVALGAPPGGNYVVTTDRRSNSANAPAAADPASIGQSTTADATNFAGFTGLTVRHTRTRNRGAVTITNGNTQSNRNSFGFQSVRDDRGSAGQTTMSITITNETSFARISTSAGSMAARGPAWVNGDSGLGLSAADVAAATQLSAGTFSAQFPSNGLSLAGASTGRAQVGADTFSDAYSARYTGSSSVAITIGSLSPVTSTFQNIGQPTAGQFTATSSGSSITAPTGDATLTNFGGVTGLTVRRDSDGNNVSLTASGGSNSRSGDGNGGPNVRNFARSITVPDGITVNRTVNWSWSMTNVMYSRPDRSQDDAPYGWSLVTADVTLTIGDVTLTYSGAVTDAGSTSLTNPAALIGSWTLVWELGSGSGISISGGNAVQTDLNRTRGNQWPQSVRGGGNNLYNLQPGAASRQPTGSSDGPVSGANSSASGSFTISGTASGSTELRFALVDVINDPGFAAWAPQISGGTGTGEAYFGRYTGSGTVTVGGTSVGSSDTSLPLPVSGRYNVDTGFASTFTIDLDTSNVGVFPNVVGGVFAASVNRATAYNQIASAIVNEYPLITTNIVNDVLQIDTNQERNLAGSAVINAGNGGINTSPTFNSAFQDGTTVEEGSTYTVTAPDGTIVGSFTSSVADTSESDLAEVQAMATTLINGYRSAEIDSSTVDTTTAGTFEITNGFTGPIEGLWSITAVHPEDPFGGDRQGDIAFAAFTEDTTGVAGGSFDVTVTLPGATEALDTVTATNNTTSVVDGLDLVRSGINNAITDDSWTAAGTGTTLDLTSATGGAHQGLFSVVLSNPQRGATLPTVSAFTEQTQGRDAALAGRLTLTEISPTGVRDTFYDQAQTAQTAAQVAAIARDQIAARDAFSVTGSGTSAGVQTTAFGPSAPTIEVVATLGTFLDLSTGAASADESIVSISQLQTRDLERPWPTTFINEGFNFVVGASRQSATTYNVVAFDVGFSEMNSSFTSYVERKNIHVRPTKETESIKVVFIDTEGDAPADPVIGDNDSTFAVRLRTTNAAGQADRVDLSQDSADNESYMFTYGGVQADYKTDVRLTGRILNYRIEDTSGQDWSIAELGLEIGEGGTR